MKRKNYEYKLQEEQNPDTMLRVFKAKKENKTEKYFLGVPITEEDRERTRASILERCVREYVRLRRRYGQPVSMERIEKHIAREYPAFSLPSEGELLEWAK